MGCKWNGLWLYSILEIENSNLMISPNINYMQQRIFRCICNVYDGCCSSKGLVQLTQIWSNLQGYFASEKVVLFN